MKQNKSSFKRRDAIYGDQIRASLGTSLAEYQGGEVASSYNDGATPDQAFRTNTGASVVNVYVLVWRYPSTRTTCQLKVSY